MKSIVEPIFCLSASKWNDNVNMSKSEAIIPFQSDREGS